MIADLLRNRVHCKRRATPQVSESASASALTRLRLLFRRNGYVRWQNRARLRKATHRTYKKGDEVRLVANSREELSTIRRLLKEVGFKLGRPFAKGLQFRQPIYGKGQVARFLELIGMRKGRKQGKSTER